MGGQKPSPCLMLVLAIRALVVLSAGPRQDVQTDGNHVGGQGHVDCVLIGGGKRARLGHLIGGVAGGELLTRADKQLKRRG